MTVSESLVDPPQNRNTSCLRIQLCLDSSDSHPTNSQLLRTGLTICCSSWSMRSLSRNQVALSQTDFPAPCRLCHLGVLTGPRARDEIEIHQHSQRCCRPPGMIPSTRLATSIFLFV